jgi:nucleotide-binding universal stress UspA family protein
VAPESIVETAGEARADLIVIGTHGRTGLSRLVIGSVAERVVRLASCPVLTMKPTVVTPEAARAAA